MFLIEFSRSEVDPSSLGNENKYHYPGIQNMYKKGNVEFSVLSAISGFIPLHEKFLQFEWLRAVVFQLILKYLHVKITNLLWVVV